MSDKNGVLDEAVKRGEVILAIAESATTGTFGGIERSKKNLHWVEQLKESFRRAKRRYELVHGGTSKHLELARIGLRGSVE